LLRVSEEAHFFKCFRELVEQVLNGENDLSLRTANAKISYHELKDVDLRSLIDHERSHGNEVEKAKVIK